MVRCVSRRLRRESRSALGQNGRLMVLVEMGSGKKLWSRPLAEEYGAPSGYFGAGSTPLVAEGRILLNLGADRKEAGLMALELKTGKTVWGRSREQASYAAPIRAILNTQNGAGNKVAAIS